MTENRRIVLNVIATYGRSLYALACGLFSFRWVLQALGPVDYGLVGLIGGLAGFIVFINQILSVAVSRFYAFSVGQARVAASLDEGIEECRRWFNLAFFMHTILSTLLVSVGYPIGVWAVECFLDIPADRVADCVWLWRFVCMNAFVGMFAVPFTAMYTAKQKIAELTVYSFATTTLNIIFLYYMAHHPGYWLVKYSFWTMCMILAPNVIIAIRALIVFPECRFNPRYFLNWPRLVELLKFGGGRLFGIVGKLTSNQGLAIAVNKFLGPAKNGTMTLGRGIMNQTMSLAASLTNAFSPAITNATGAGDYVRMRDLTFRACSYSTLAMLIFAIPLCIEAQEVLNLWLGNPPECAVELCICLMIMDVVDRTCEGHWMAIFAMGKVVKFQTVEAISNIIELVVGITLLILGWDIVGVGIALIVGKITALVVKLFYGRSLAGLSVRYWVRRVLLPVLFVSSITFVVGCSSRLILDASFARVVITTLLCEMTIFVSSWMFVFSESDKLACRSKLTSLVSRLRG